MDIGAYHVLELQIAADPADTRRVMPSITAAHRRIVDVGCGAGQTLIASRLPEDVIAVGVDCDQGALSLGRLLYPRLRLARARGESLPLPTAYFDLAISRVALPYMRTGAALAEMARVLRPGGRLLVLEITKPSGRLGTAVLKGYMRGVVPLIAKAVARGQDTAELWRYYWDTIEACIAPESVLAALRAAGFEDVKRHLELGIFSEYSASKPA